MIAETIVEAHGGILAVTWPPRRRDLRWVHIPGRPLEVTTNCDPPALTMAAEHHEARPRRLTPVSTNPDTTSPLTGHR
jgi:hypothetical protein